MNPGGGRLRRHRSVPAGEPAPLIRSPSLNKAFFVLLVLVVAGSCARTGNWENQNLPKEQWPLDAAACRRGAAAEVEKEAAREEILRPGGPSGTGGAYEAEMSRYDALKRRDALTARCMKIRGYRPG